jgi:hypothetical protein
MLFNTGFLFTNLDGARSEPGVVSGFDYMLISSYILAMMRERTYHVCL